MLPTEHYQLPTQKNHSMPNRIDLIYNLTQATAQLKHAALNGDWAVAENIQKRRALLVTQIVAQHVALPLSLAQQHAVLAVREQEMMIVARAKTRHQALALALSGQQLDPLLPKKSTRMTRAYRNADPH
jgi:hypothetical protein